jgi:beta-glucanase (GH16 family)
MKVTPLLACITGAFVLFAPALRAAQPKLVWSDEFNQTANSGPDAAKWTYDLGGGGWGNNELETYTDSRANSYIAADSAASDGKALVIAAVKASNGSITSARLKTQGKFTFTYGRAEARLKTGDGKGIWPAFWMLGDNITSVSWPTCGEIDVLETVGAAPTIAYGTLHGPGYSGEHGIGNHTTVATGTLASAYHVYAVDWTPDKIVWSMDGTICHTVTPKTLPAGASWVFTRPFFMILNLAVGGYWPGNPDGTTKFPQTLKVDYVRVYAWPGPAPTSFTGYAARADQAQLSWSAPALPSGTTLKGFTLERATDSAFTKNRKIFPLGNVTSTVDTTVAAGTAYYYRVAAVTSGGTTDFSTTLKLTTPAKTATGTATLARVAGQLYCGTGANVINLGFTIDGTAARTVLLRALGPTFKTTAPATATVLADPVIQLYRGSKLIASNDDWKTNGNASALLKAQTPAGAVPPLATASKDAALLVTLAPGTYTLTVKGKSNGTGLAFVDIALVP